LLSAGFSTPTKCSICLRVFSTDNGCCLRPSKERPPERADNTCSPQAECKKPKLWPAPTSHVPAAPPHAYNWPHRRPCSPWTKLGLCMAKSATCQVSGRANCGFSGRYSARCPFRHALPQLRPRSTPECATQSWQSPATAARCCATAGDAAVLQWFRQTHPPKGPHNGREDHRHPRRTPLRSHGGAHRPAHAAQAIPRLRLRVANSCDSFAQGARPAPSRPSREALREPQPYARTTATCLWASKATP